MGEVLMTDLHYPGKSPQPGGDTAIIAGVLAILGGLWHLLGTIVTIVVIADGTVAVLLFFLAGSCAAAAGCLVIGGIGLFLKKPMGRLSTVLGCGLALVVCAVVAGVVVIPDNTTFPDNSKNEVVSLYGWAALVVLAAPPIMTLVLTLVKPTARWVGRAEPALPPSRP
jgi:peptidoglycan/LPS O-acetylase OafA/YrhL